MVISLHDQIMTYLACFKNLAFVCIRRLCRCASSLADILHDRHDLLEREILLQPPGITRSSSMSLCAIDDDLNEPVCVRMSYDCGVDRCGGLP